MHDFTTYATVASEVSKRQPTFQQTAFSVPQVAARWEVSPRHIYDLCAQGKLGYLRVGNLIRVRAEDIAAYESQNWHAPGSNVQITNSSNEASVGMCSGGKTAGRNAFLLGRQSAAKAKFG